MSAYSTETLTRDEVWRRIEELLSDATDEQLCDVLAELCPGSYRIGDKNATEDADRP